MNQLTRFLICGILIPSLLLAHLSDRLNGASRDNRPNVIIVYTDDQGTLDAHCYGLDDLITPNIDRLAQTGARFTQMCSPSAICSAFPVWGSAGKL